MEGGRVNDFIEAFAYQSVALIYRGEKYFSDGITKTSNGKFNFFIIKVDEMGVFICDVFENESESVEECIKAFESAPIWDGRTFYEAEKEMTWVDW